MAGKSNTEGRKGSDLFIVDNSDDLWRVEEYLREWTGQLFQFTKQIHTIRIFYKFYNIKRLK